MSDENETHQTSEAEGAYWRDNIRLLVNHGAKCTGQHH